MKIETSWQHCSIIAESKDDSIMLDKLVDCLVTSGNTNRITIEDDEKGITKELNIHTYD